MGLYGNSIEIIDEGFIDKESIELIRKWKVSNEADRIKRFKSTSLSDEEYKDMKNCIEIIKSTENYGEYKKAFTRLCKFCHILPTGVIVCKYELSKGKKENENSLYVEYSENTKKIQLPQGTKLYHMSKVSGIEKLIPQFKGKSERGYLYDKPRIYFTIRKEMPKMAADYKLTEKMHKYLCKKDIKEVYVDPLVRSNIMGAVYIETMNPVSVEEIGLKNKEIEESEFNFEDFFKFVTENGLVLENEED